MSSFTSDLVVSPLSDGRRWRLCRSFTYHVGSRHSRDIIRVPKAFETDFASTDILQWLAILSIILWSGLMWILPTWVAYIFLLIILLALLITPYGRQGKPSVLHDYLYQTHSVSRHMADLIFYEAMEVTKTNPTLARLMYYGVRIGGWMAWY